MCARDTTFHLLVKISAFDATVIGVICDACDYEVLADSTNERQRLPRAAELWRQHETGALDAAAFTDALDALGSTTLTRIVTEAQTWKCPTCAHENPRHFVTCWHCSYARPLAADESALERGDSEESAC